MIALCLEHAAQADNGAFTDDQLRELKRSGGDQPEAVEGRFEWLRQEVLARVGGSFFYQTPLILRVGSVPCIWLSRDDRRNLMVNFRMPTMSGRPRASIIENFWSIPTDVGEIICPPMGRLIDVTYRNGDRFRAELLDIADATSLQARYPRANIERWAPRLTFPITIFEAWETAIGMSLDFGPNQFRLGDTAFTEGFMSNCEVAIQIGDPDSHVARVFPPEV